MNFIPLAIWCVGSLFVAAYVDRTCMLEVVNTVKRRNERRNAGELIFLGAIFFFLVGIVLQVLND